MPVRTRLAPPLALAALAASAPRGPPGASPPASRGGDRAGRARGPGQAVAVAVAREGEVGIGGEESGRVGVTFFLPERDGVLTALLLLETVALSGLSFLELLAQQAARYGAFAYDRRDLHRPMPLLRASVERLEKAPPPAIAGQRVTGVETLDGVKLSFGGRGWLLHRLSGTEPILRVYAEHEEEETVRRLLDEAVSALESEAG